MDLVFNALPDVFSYQSLRHASYDAPWLNEDGARSKGAAGAGRRPAHERPRAREACGGGGGGGRDRRDACPLCQEKQRRPLATYIRSKSRQDRREDSSIQELKEEEEEEEEEAVGATGAAAAHAHATAHATAAAAAHTTPAAART